MTVKSFILDGGWRPSHLFVEDFGVDQPVKEGPEMTVADEWVFVLVPMLHNIFFVRHSRLSRVS